MLIIKVKKLEMTAEKKKINYKRIFTFGSKVNQQVNSEEFLDNIQYSEKINKVLTMINLPKNILGKRKKFNSKELYF